MDTSEYDNEKLYGFRPGVDELQEAEEIVLLELMSQ